MSEPLNHSAGGLTTAERLGTPDNFGTAGFVPTGPAVASSRQDVPDKPQLPQPGPDSLAASTRLRTAAPYAAYLEKKGEVRRLQAQIDRRAERVRQGMVNEVGLKPSHSLPQQQSTLEAILSNEQEKQDRLVEELEIARKQADAALETAYRNQVAPPYESAYSSDVKRLHDHILGVTQVALQQVWKKRQENLNEIAARYTAADQLFDLGVAAAIVLSCRSEFPFVFATEESAIAAGYIPELYPRIRAEDIVRDHSLSWQSWASDLNDREDIAALVGHSDSLALRQSLLMAHPILALADRVWKTPLSMRRAMLPHGGDFDPEAIGGRVFSLLYTELRSNLTALSIDPATLATSAKSYQAAQPLYLQSGADVFCRPGKSGDATQDPLFRVIEYESRLRVPGDKWAPVTWVLAATGLALLVGGVILGPAFVVGTLVLELAIGAIATGIQMEKYREASALAAASDAEEAFRLIDPTLEAIETGQTAWSEGLLLLVEILFFALPITTLLPKRTPRIARADTTDPLQGQPAIPSTGDAKGVAKLSESSGVNKINSPDSGLGSAPLAEPAGHLPATTSPTESTLPPRDADSLWKDLFGDFEAERISWDSNIPSYSAADLDTEQIPELVARQGQVAFEQAPTSLSRLAASKPQPGKMWDWFQSNRSGLGFDPAQAGQAYRELLDALGLPKTRIQLRHARRYFDHLRDDKLLHRYWAQQDPPLAINLGTEKQPDWRYYVNDSGKWKWLPRRSEIDGRTIIDFGHIIDVVVWDKAVFLIENELWEQLARGRIAAERVDEAENLLRKAFMNFTRNYVPELKGPNRANGGTVRIFYSDEITFRQAMARMLDTKAGTHLPAATEHPLQVLEALLEQLVPQIPESALLKRWLQELRDRPTPSTPGSTMDTQALPTASPSSVPTAAERGLPPQPIPEH